MHYKRIEHCLNITADVVAQFPTFQVLDEKEYFFNAALQESLWLSCGSPIVEAISGRPEQIEATDFEYPLAYALQMVLVISLCAILAHHNPLNSHGAVSIFFYH